MCTPLWRTVLAATLLAPTLGFAQTASTLPADWSLSGNLSLVSDYRFRGISQTYRLPAVQGGFDLSHAAGFYAGTWASNVSGNQYPGGNGMELDVYGGYRFDTRPSFAPNYALNVDLGFIYYAYPDAKTASGQTFNTTEVFGGVALNNFSAKLSYALSDYFGANDSVGSYYLDFGYTHPISPTASIVLHIGRLDVRHGTQGGAPDPDYTDYKIGVRADAAGFAWGISYIGNDAHDNAYTVAHATRNTTRVVSKDTLVFSVGKTF